MGGSGTSSWIPFNFWIECKFCITYILAMAGNFMAVSPFLKGQSLTGSFSSQSFSVSQYDRFAIQVKVYNTSAQSGVLKLQVSINNTDFVDVSDATFSLAGDEVFMISVTQFAYRFIRIDYQASSGTGLIDAEINTVNFAK